MRPPLVVNRFGPSKFRSHEDAERAFAELELFLRSLASFLANPQVADADIAAAAAIGYAKLNLAGRVRNTDIAADAAIAMSKLALAITDAEVAPGNKDGPAGTPSLRTLGNGALQACAGNDLRLCLGLLDADPASPANGNFWWTRLADVGTDANTLALWNLHNQDWLDDSGNGKTLTAYGGASLGPTGATFARASGQYAENLALNLVGLSEATVEAWVRFTTLPQSGEVYTVARQYYNAGLDFYHTGSALRIRWFAVTDAGNANLTYDLSGDELPVVDTWYHLAGTFKANTDGGSKLYWNGQVKATYSGTTPNGTFGYNDGRFRVAVHADAAAHYFNGMLDGLRLSNLYRYPTDFTPTRFGVPHMRLRSGGATYKGAVLIPA